MRGLKLFSTRLCKFEVCSQKTFIHFCQLCCFGFSACFKTADSYTGASASGGIGGPLTMGSASVGRGMGAGAHVNLGTRFRHCGSEQWFGCQSASICDEHGRLREHTPPGSRPNTPRTARRIPSQRPTSRERSREHCNPRHTSRYRHGDGQPLPD